MVVRTDDWMHGWVSVCVGCLLVVAWAYGRLIHARGPLPKGLRALRHARGPAGPLLTNKQHTFTQPCIQSSIHLTICPYTHPHIHSHAHSFTHPFIHPLSVRPLIHPFTHLNDPLSINPLIHPPVHTSIHPPIQTTTYRSILPSIHSPKCNRNPSRQTAKSSPPTTGLVG